MYKYDLANSYLSAREADYARACIETRPSDEMRRSARLLIGRRVSLSGMRAQSYALNTRSIPELCAARINRLAARYRYRRDRARNCEQLAIFPPSC